MKLLSQSALIVALVSLALGASVMSRDLKNKLYLAFAALCAVVTGWGLFFFLSVFLDSSVHYGLHLLFNLWLGPAGLLMIRMLIRPQDRATTIVFWAAFIHSLIFTFTLIWGLEQDSWWVRQLIYFAPAWVVVQLVRLLWIDWKFRSLSARGETANVKIPSVGISRRTWIYFGALGVLSLAVMDHVPALGQVLPSLSNLGLAIYLFFLSQAITQRRLLNLSALVTRFLTLLVLACLLTLIYSMLLSSIADRLGLFLLNSLAISFFVVLLIEPLKKAIEFGVKKMRPARQAWFEQTSQHYLREISKQTRPPGLARVLIECLESLLGAKQLAVYFVTSDGSRLRHWKSSERILIGHPLVQRLIHQKKRRETALLLDQLILSDIERSASRNQRQELTALLAYLRAFSATLALPIWDGDHLVGLVLAQVDRPPEPWGSNWSLLNAVADFLVPVGQVLKSMEQYDRTREIERLATLGTLAAGLAHEVRNPLGSIRGAAQLLLQNQPQEKFLSMIIEETDRLNRVVSQFLEFSGPSAPLNHQQSAEVLTPTEIEEVCRDAVEWFLTGISLASSKTGPIQAIVERSHQESSKHSWEIRFSRETLRQILLNLLQNAYRALEGRPQPKIVVRIEKIEDSLLVSVEDNGCGIRAEDLEKLFLPFFTTHADGNGLGLALCRKAVEASGGRMEVSSEVGVGSVFTLVLGAAIPKE